MNKIIFIFLFLTICLHFFGDDLSSDSTDDPAKQLKLIQNVRISGIVLTCIGGTSLLAGLILGGFFIFNEAGTPGSVLVYKSGSGYYTTYIYFNPLILCLNLTGSILAVVGISQLAWSGYKEKRLKRSQMTFLKDYAPEIGYDLKSNKIYLGARIIL
jgi:hypothetical protein